MNSITWVKTLHKQTIKAIAHVQNFLSFVFLDTAISSKIQAVYLFGSAVRGDLEPESDIDVFIDTKEEKLVGEHIKKALSNFLSSNDYEKWRLLRFTYPLALQAGNLIGWHLKESIASEGILLYSKDVAVIPKERKLLVKVELPKDKKKYLRFARLLCGRAEKGYKDKGFLAHVNGERIGSNIILLPKESQYLLTELLNKEKINYTLTEIVVQ